MDAGGMMWTEIVMRMGSCVVDRANQGAQFNELKSQRYLGNFNCFIRPPNAPQKWSGRSSNFMRFNKNKNKICIKLFFCLFY